MDEKNPTPEDVYNALQNELYSAYDDISRLSQKINSIKQGITTLLERSKDGSEED